VNSASAVMLPIRIPTPASVKQSPAMLRSRFRAGAGAVRLVVVVAMSEEWSVAAI
jgi:hypothetical protein